MKILRFEWDNAKGEDQNGKHLMIGKKLTQSQNNELSDLEIYGLSLDIVDNSKDNRRLKKLSCYGKNIVGDVKEISREDAKQLLMTEIENALDVLYNSPELEYKM